MDSLNSRIAKCIELSGLTKTAFAGRINLSQSHISRIALGEASPSDRTICDICREFDIDENWLRTGDGEMYVKLSRDEEIAAFMGDVLKGETGDFRRRFIAVLSRMTPEEWEMLERKALELIEEIKTDAEKQ